MNRNLDWYLEGPCAQCPRVDFCEENTCESWQEYQAMLKSIKKVGEE